MCAQDDEEVAAVSSAYTALAAPGDPAASDEELEPEESEDGSPRTRQYVSLPLPLSACSVDSHSHSHPPSADWLGWGSTLPLSVGSLRINV